MSVQPRKVRLYIAAAFLLMLATLVFIEQAFNLNPYLSPSDPNQIVLLYTLTTLIFLTLLVFGFVLLRTLVKVWAERRQHKPGSKFKTSLLAWLVALTLVPAISVFAYAYGLMNRNMDKWFSVPVDQIFSATSENNQQWQLEREALARPILQHLGRELPADFDAARQLFRMRALMTVDLTGRVTMVAAESGLPLDGLGNSVVAEMGKKTEAFLPFNADWVAARRIQTPAGPKILAAVFPSPQRIADLTAQISQQKSSYDELIRNQRTFKITYASLLALMTVLVMFAAVWVGIFLSKRITLPIEALSEATQEISAGNLGYRVDIKAEDELGILVSRFNGMAERLQETTRELETRRRAMEVILESIPTGVVAVDANLRIHTLNRAARSMFNAEYGAQLPDVFKGTDMAAINAILEDANDKSVTREVAFSTPGRPAHSAVTASPLTTGGFVLVVEDLTEVVRAQKASTWREVARRLAHEIKNPLTPIQLSAERIARNISKLPSATPRVTTVMQECVDAIVDEVSGLKNLVDEFVRFARLPTVSRVPNEMRDLVDKTLALYDGRMEGIDLKVSIPADLPLVLMDHMQMKRVLINLIDNAIDALSTETVKCLNITCDLARDGTMARLIIEDTGRGIAQEDRERMFTPYFSTRKNGTGLGLSISSRIVADHGGYIGVEPNSPRGTRFVIELPLCQESSLSTTSPASGNR